MAENVKPRRIWAVGDDVFEDYQDALVSAARHRRSVLANSIIAEIADAISRSATSLSPQESASHIHAALLLKFNISLKKTK